MKNVDVRKFIIKALPLMIFFYLANKIGQAFRLSPGIDISGKILNLGGGFTAAFELPLPSFHPQDFIVGVLGGAIIYAVVYFRGKNAKKYRKGVEYGSARWGKEEDIKPYMNQKTENNIILTQTESLTMNPRPKNPAYARNKNVLVVGGSGSGKTRFFIKPNLMQCQSKTYPVSFVVTDPKGVRPDRV